jgi:fibro-slime domain-containing protein
MNVQRLSRFCSRAMRASTALLVTLAVSCSSSDDKGKGNGNGDGDGDGDHSSGDGDDLTPGDGDSNSGCGSTLHATIRDFSADHPDFENDDFMNESGDRGDRELTGIVEQMLGADRKPVYAHDGPTPQTTGVEEYGQWYHDTEGVNQTFSYDIVLESQGDGKYVYDNSFFFPIDDKGFGNHGKDANGQMRNFWFTTEIHTKFNYKGGEVFTFDGDDDLWLFINGKLAIDLGGLHPMVRKTVDLDAEAERLGITPGDDQQYTMDIFHAERHTDASNFHIETTIGCLVPVVL